MDFYKLIGVGLCCILWSNMVMGQDTIRGKLVDKITQEPLSGANIQDFKARFHTITNAHGEFELITAIPVDSIRVSYLGYQQESLPVQQSFMIIEMKPSIVNLNEILIMAQGGFDNQQQAKPLSSLDEYLEASRRVNMIKRGAYAWEASLNDMSAERLSVTIDGMHIFRACTDDMDPVTSYVDVSNLEKVEISSGQQGAVYGNVIGGAINLELDKGSFIDKGWTGTLKSGYETNNKQQIFGGSLNYADDRFFINSEATYRKAENYKAGGASVVPFSQYNKFNIALNSGYRLNDHQKLYTSLIYDRAWDVGYPALPMDVSLARAVIASASFVQDRLFKVFHHWETKVYYNSIKHVMDDSNRPDVPIHMDMPGWSDTYGFYSKAHLKADDNQLFFKLDGYYNRSLAEMTMYPDNQSAPTMYMLTWPDVGTLNIGFYMADHINFENERSLKLATRLTIQHANVANTFGLNSLKIMYPEMSGHASRFLKSFSAKLFDSYGNFDLNFGVSYGDRAPSVSEAYGFYIFNNFDNYDYIGNPNLKNEGALEANVTVSYSKSKFEFSASARYFRIDDYIIGKINSSLDRMTIGADGVKMYVNLPYAQLFNASFSGSYNLSQAFDLHARVSYHRGVDDQQQNLPLISPVSYRAALHFAKNQYSVSLVMNGAAKQSNYAPEYGEKQAPAYTLLAMSFGKHFYLGNDDIFAKVGIENIFDVYYSAYSDWNNIPQMGRNFYINLTYKFN